MPGDGKFYGTATTIDGEHVTLDRETAEALWTACEKSRGEREALMPDMHSVMHLRSQVSQRLSEFGWREGMYCPKDGSEFAAIMHGSSGIFPAAYFGEWPSGKVHIFGDECHHGEIIWKAVKDLNIYEAAKMSECIDMERRAADAETRRFAHMAQYSDGDQ